MVNILDSVALESQWEYKISHMTQFAYIVSIH